MTDILSVVANDIHEYKRLCKKYEEDIQCKKDAWDNDTPNCYGEHSEKLRERELKEKPFKHH